MDNSMALRDERKRCDEQYRKFVVPNITTEDEGKYVAIDIETGEFELNGDDAQGTTGRIAPESGKSFDPGSARAPLSALSPNRRLSRRRILRSGVISESTVVCRHSSSGVRPIPRILRSGICNENREAGRAILDCRSDRFDRPVIMARQSSPSRFRLTEDRSNELVRILFSVHRAPRKHHEQRPIMSVMLS